MATVIAFIENNGFFAWWASAFVPCLLVIALTGKAAAEAQKNPNAPMEMLLGATFVSVLGPLIFIPGLLKFLHSTIKRNSP